MTDYIQKRYGIDDVLPGMEVGKDVLTDSGQIMLTVGTILTESIIEGLKCWDVPSVFIQEKISTPKSIDVPVVKEIPLSKSQRKFCNQYDETMSQIKKTFATMRDSKEAPFQELKQLADQSIFPMLESVGVINHLQMIGQQDDYTFQHSVNVAVICGMLGKWLGYTGAALTDLVLAGLLHDIGKTQIPLDILNKPGALSAQETEIMKNHSMLGYKLIKDNKNLSPNIIYAVLQHHERMDGSGYPFKVTKDKWHEYARIVAVADTYAAMTAQRVYHDKDTPFAVVESMNNEMFNKLDPHICTVFLNNVRNYFVGNFVQLSDGRRAEVVYLGQFIASRPTVCTQDGQFIDLERNKNISIIDIIET
ncbi:HD-GYP domain-containing protein [Pelosinus sp. sgz500959]|uniref:HD-GYP domain-containing protein n=1 Tax=Pelosinus sp. sgz500959 TaxID=3242472 RepID=UPI0036729F8D